MRRNILATGSLALWATVATVAAQGQAGSSEPPAVLNLPSSMGEVAFPHRDHVAEFAVECKACHHETNARTLAIPHQGYFDDFWIDCKTCHGEHAPAGRQVVACSRCHHGSPANIADETLSAKVVMHKNCWSCHEVKTGAQASRACRTCHTGPRSKLERGNP